MAFKLKTVLCGGQELGVLVADHLHYEVRINDTPVDPMNFNTEDTSGKKLPHRKN